MCGYTYSWYRCNHSYYIWQDSIEICTNRFLSSYSSDAWSIGKNQSPPIPICVKNTLLLALDL
ncbi:hypothetical protein E4T43_06737 [Aureobasidium subglaciale]|nr:hypothetical protein E4T43_06737 [Aureobasidium subglaciale]